MDGTSRAVLALDIGGTELEVAVVTSDGVPHGLLALTRAQEGPFDLIHTRTEALHG